MRFLLPFLMVTALFSATPSAEDPEVIRARNSIERLRSLVEAGAIPRNQLEQAENALADAQDMALLKRTMYAQDLTEDQADNMVAAAKRRLDRRQKQLDNIKGMVDAGVASRGEMGTFLEEVDYARKEYDLAMDRANIVRELSAMAHAEQERQAQAVPTATEANMASVRYDGKGVFTTAEFQQVSKAFEKRFQKPLPVSALGETAVHRSLGFDHRGRVDVAISPNQPEGMWLRSYLEARHIPYFAFWHAVPGKATGAHIHMGPESTRLAMAKRPGRGSLTAD